jgi:glutaredoxin
MRIFLLSLFLLASDTPPKLMLYYSGHCVYSKKVLNYLDQTQRKIPMKNVDISLEAKEELKKWGGTMIVPCLIVDGKPIYDANTIIEWLREHRDAA